MNDLTLKPSILLIDDLVENMRIRAKMVEQMGCEVLMATDYASAMKAFSNNEVDLLVIDYYLANNRTGEEIAREARRRNPTVPMIMLTGAVSLPESAKECVNEVIIKGSAGPTALMDAIKRLVPNAVFKPSTRR